MRMCVCLSISQHSEANTKTMAISRPTSTPNLPLRPMFQPGSALLSRNLGSASFCQKISLATTTLFKLYIHSHTHTLSISLNNRVEVHHFDTSYFSVYSPLTLPLHIHTQIHKYVIFQSVPSLPSQ